MPKLKLWAPLLCDLAAYACHPVTQQKLAPHPKTPENDAFHVAPSTIVFSLGELIEHLGIIITDRHLQFVPQFLR